MDTSLYWTVSWVPVISIIERFPLYYICKTDPAHIIQFIYSHTKVWRQDVWVNYTFSVRIHSGSIFAANLPSCCPLRWSSQSLSFLTMFTHAWATVFCTSSKVPITTNSSLGVSDESRTSGFLVTSGHCWPSTGDEWHFHGTRPCFTSTALSEETVQGITEAFLFLLGC